MNYENLLLEADTLNIIVKELPLQTDDGLCFGNRIAIDKKLETTAEKACTLSEELGHFNKTVGDITNQSILTNKKQEILARRWGYSRLVRMEDLINAYKHGCRNRYEISEYLNVTEEFLDDTLNYYRQKHGLCVGIDNYIIYFEPTLGILEIF